MANIGPTSNLPGRARRRGRSGTAWRDAFMLGEVTAVDWDVEIEQIEVLIAGTWRNEMIPGAETRRGTFRHQDIDDRFKLEVWRYVRDRSNAVRGPVGSITSLPPEFNLIVKIDDLHAPGATRWELIGCQLYTYSGGYSNDDDILTREVPFSFRDDRPLDAIEYTKDGIITGTPV